MIVANGGIIQSDSIQAVFLGSFSGRFIVGTGGVIENIWTFGIGIRTGSGTASNPAISPIIIVRGGLVSSIDGYV